MVQGDSVPEVVKLYISPKCIFCRILEPGVRFVFEVAGRTLEVYKLGRDGIARQVNGNKQEQAGWVPAVPALSIGNVTLIGFGMLRFLRQLEMEANRGTV
jgi:hypothetical protein